MASSKFRDRLGTYLIGVAIGCVLTGWLIYRRGLARQQAQPQGTQQVEPGEAQTTTGAGEGARVPGEDAAEPDTGGAAPGR